MEVAVESVPKRVQPLCSISNPHLQALPIKVNAKPKQRKAHVAAEVVEVKVIAGSMGRFLSVVSIKTINKTAARFILFPCTG